MDPKTRRNEFAASFQALRRPTQPATARRDPLPVCSLEAICCLTMKVALLFLTQIGKTEKMGLRREKNGETLRR